ncbi:MAG: MOSC domain-containing protein, partial [Chloroflexota bacterium]
MPNTTEKTGILRAVYLGLDPDTFFTTAQPELTAEFTGFAGDKHAGFTRPADSRTPWYPRGTQIRNDRQLSLVSVEELAEVARLLQVPEIQPEWLGANLLIVGVPDLSLLPPNTRLFFSG